MVRVEEARGARGSTRTSQSEGSVILQLASPELCHPEQHRSRLSALQQELQFVVCRERPVESPLEQSKTMAQIFISYRREEGSPYARMVFDSLSRHFGPADVFYDHKAIEPGLDFLEVIQQELNACNVLIALIGDDWLTYTNAGGARRIDEPDDIVHQEIATALQRNIRLIPVLVRGTTMPKADQLPKPLAKLANRNAIELTEAKWEYDQQRLIEILQKVLGGNATPKAVQGTGTGDGRPRI